MRRILVMLALLAIVACHATSSPSPPDRHADRYRYGGVEYSADQIEMSLSRTECYGECPVYTVTVRGDGEVVFRGEKYVSTLGEHRWYVDGTALRILLECFEGVHFMNLEDKYVENVSDSPRAFLTLRLGDQTKTVENYWSAGISQLEPRSSDLMHGILDDLAFFVDTCAGTRSVVGKW